jgi:protein-L-isoaspartate(D-aspartate) O-methyltransferase
MDEKRQEMVNVIKERYGLESPEVLSAMLQVPREKFVSKLYRPIAYNDGPVSIGHGQTMSQPYTVAFMTHLLLSDKRQAIRDKIKKWRVLEIGTGSGYQAAILSHLVKEVYSVEIVDELARKARKLLKKFKYHNVHIKAGSGEKGWPDKAPFDAIMITAGVEGKVPQELFDQLKDGGVLVAPVGRGYDKTMTRYIKKSKYKFKKSVHDIFHFVPFVEE